MEMSELSGKQKRARTLVQYRDMTDEQFLVAMEKQKSKPKIKKKVFDKFEREIEAKLDEFSKDYDLSDMKINDKMSLRALIQAVLTLEDYEQRMYKYRAESESFDNIQNVRTLTEVMKTLRKDISSIQNDLNITRKTRKSDKDVSVIAFIDDLKDKAKRTYAAKMKYIYCPNCDMLLGTIWTQYDKKGKFQFVCQRHLPNGKICGTKVNVTLEQLESLGGTNKPDIVPEAIK